MPTILLRSGLLAAFLVFASSCGSSDSGGSANCQGACAAAAAAKCPNDKDCVAKCEQVVSISPTCKDKMAALVNCSAGRPGSDWECGADGESELKDGVCNAEGEAAAMCLLGGS